MIARANRGFIKLFYGLIWKLISWRAPKPTIELVHESADGATMVYCCHGPAYIEPDTGYVITAQGYILEQSMLPNWDYEQRPFRISIPSPFQFWRAVRGARPVIKHKEVASLRHFWEWNYYHFYLDVVGKLELLHQVGLPDHMPLVLARYVDDVSFVRPLIERGKMRKRNWVVPVGAYIQAEKIYFCRTGRPYRHRISFIKDALKVPAPPNSDGRRIYICRTGTRKVTNLDAIKPILTKYAFEIVDTAAMSIDEQIELFSGVRYVIANHGAGTTNILFRAGKPLSVLELHHENLLNYDHKKICDEYDYYWDHLDGKMEPGAPEHADFYISPDCLEKKIGQMLKHNLVLSCINLSNTKKEFEKRNDQQIG